jgi:enoyl-CoA hydratase/carnithine racemase
MSTTDAPELLIDRQAGGLVRLTLNRPGRRHALSLSLLQALEQALTTIADDPLARVVVIASSGPVFSSGHDLGEMRDRSQADYSALFATCADVMQKIRALTLPVIARVQGFATAAGCQLVAACDLAVASDKAQFATPGVRIGLFCTTPMVPLVRAVPSKIAMEMLLTGQPLSAQRALAAGLVNAIAPDDQLDQIIQQYADAILASSPQVIALGKREFYLQRQMEESAAYDRAVTVMTHNACLPDAQEGIAAFLEKRPPVWEATPRQ